MKDLRTALGLSKAVLAHAAAGRDTHDERIAQWLDAPLTWIQHGGPFPWPAIQSRGSGKVVACDTAPEWAAALIEETREIRADIALLLRAAATAGDKDLLNLLDRRDAPQAQADSRPIAAPRGSRDGL